MSKYVEYPKWVKNAAGDKILCKDAEAENKVRTMKAPQTDPPPKKAA